MSWKKILWPSKWKILFLIVYAILYLLFGFTYVTDVPDSFGFPFTYQTKGCYFFLTPSCVDVFFPHFLLLDILIPIAIYVAIGLFEARNKQ